MAPERADRIYARQLERYLVGVEDFPTFAHHHRTMRSRLRDHIVYKFIDQAYILIREGTMSPLKFRQLMRKLRG